MSERVPALQRAYRRWALAARLLPEGSNYRGTFAGHPVVVRPGLEGSAPLTVEVEFRVAHGAPTQLISENAPADAPASVRRYASALFDDPDIVLPIRSLGFAPGFLRIRLPPLSDPRLVVRVLETVAAAALDREPRGTPFR